MENETPRNQPQVEVDEDVKKDPDFKRFALKRIVIGLLIAVLLLWGGSLVVGFFDQSRQTAKVETVETHRPATADTGGHAAPAAEAPAPAETAHEPAPQKEAPAAPAAPSHGQAKALAPAAGAHGTPAVKTEPPGVVFANALIGPLNYELRERFWGWRPNDIINVTDNVNNIQLGVLEVTRRATIELAERISRTGVTASFDPHLEQAMNWLMVKAEEYMFPSAENKFKDAVDEIALYRGQLKRGEANFFTRADNLIPLLTSFEDLLGSCDENLVKQTEGDGEPVSHFMADDYFFYARGVAKAMLPIMEAVVVDFHSTLQNRNGVDVAHHAIHSLSIANEIQPWYITDADLDGILANHRANIAAPISHARFYIGVLINTLST